MTCPTGARGSFTDGMENVFGIDPQTGFARTVFDNVGMQYGSNAVNNGFTIVDEFLDLNEKIGVRKSAASTSMETTFRSEAKQILLRESGELQGCLQRRWTQHLRRAVNRCAIVLDELSLHSAIVAINKGS